MATLYLSWDNALILAEPNVTAQRAYQRLRSVGGAYSTAGFDPANDFAPAVNTAEFTAAIVNRAYEIKVAAICTTGGPTDNSNGVIEQIAFGCVEPEFEATGTTIDVQINIPDTDITKARLVLKKQSDNSVVSTVTVNKVADAIDHEFSGLTGNTGYYLEVEFYATVGGVEVISSSVNYLGAVCGGNVSGYQINTEPTVFYAYEAEVYACGDCAEPIGSIVVQSPNPALTLFKYYNADPLPDPITQVYRIIATSVNPASINIDSMQFDTCNEACEYEVIPP